MLMVLTSLAKQLKDNTQIISSKWARKETALTEEQLAAIDTHGLHNPK